MAARLVTSVTGSATKRCPFRDEIDRGTVTITWYGDASELHAVRRLIDGFIDEKVSHEEFTRRVQRATAADEVMSMWETAGLTVACNVTKEVW